MKFLLRLSIMLAIVIGGWFWWGGRREEQSRIPPFVQHLMRSVLTIEDDIRRRVQMVESGATMMKEGKVMIEKGVRGKK